MTAARHQALAHRWPSPTPTRMIDWLKAIGFTEHATYRDEADASVVVHAEWLWPGGGGIMFGSAATRTAAIDNVRRLGGVPRHRRRRRRLRAGRRRPARPSLRELVDQDYGGRGGSVDRPRGQPLVLRELPAA